MALHADGDALAGTMIPHEGHSFRLRQNAVENHEFVIRGEFQRAAASGEKVGGGHAVMLAHVAILTASPKRCGALSGELVVERLDALGRELQTQLNVCTALQKTLEMGEFLECGIGWYLLGEMSDVLLIPSCPQFGVSAQPLRSGRHDEKASHGKEHQKTCGKHGQEKENERHAVLNQRAVMPVPLSAAGVVP